MAPQVKVLWPRKSRWGIGSVSCVHLDGLNEKMLKRITHTLDGMDAEMVADKAELEAELEKDTAMTQAFSDVDYDDVATDEEGYESSGSAGHPHRMDSPAGHLARRLNF